MFLKWKVEAQNEMGLSNKIGSYLTEDYEGGKFA